MAYPPQVAPLNRPNPDGTAPYSKTGKGKFPKKTQRARKRYKQKYGHAPALDAPPGKRRKMPSPQGLKRIELKQAKQAKKHQPSKTKKHKTPGSKIGQQGGSGADNQDFLGLLDQAGADRETRAATNLEYGPTERAINADLRASQGRQGDISGWFQDYQNKLAGGKADTAAAYEKAQTNFRDQLKEAGVQDTGAREELKATAEKDAELRGVPIDRQGASDAVNAAAARQNLQTGFSGMVGTQGANQNAYFNDKERIGAGEAASQHLKELARERGIRSDLRELAKSKGDFGVKYRSDLKKGERDYSLQLKASDFDISNLAETSRSHRANEKTDRLSLGESARSHRASESETHRHNLNTESTARGNLNASLARIREDVRNHKITAAQAQQRIQQAKQRFQFDQNKEKTNKKQTSRDDKRQSAKDRYARKHPSGSSGGGGGKTPRKLG